MGIDGEPCRQLRWWVCVEAVEHEFGSGLPAWVLGDEVGIEVDTFPLLELVDVLGSICGRVTQAGYPADSCLIFKQVLTYSAKSPTVLRSGGK